MKTTVLSLWTCSCLLLIAMTATSQEVNTANTLKRSDTQSGPSATIDDVSLIQGTWTGPGFGGTCEEVWTAPRGGGMMGMFQLVNDDGIVFYELCQIVPEEGSLALKLKHFNADLTGWETQDETVDFPLVKLEGTTAWFEGLTYKREGDTLHVWVAFESEPGKKEEGYVQFQLNRS